MRIKGHVSKVWGMALLLFIGSLGIALYTPWLTVKLIRGVVAHQAKNIQLTDLKIKDQYFYFPGKIVLKDVSCTARINGRVLTMTAPEIQAVGLETLLLSKKAVAFYVTGAEVSFVPLQLLNMDVSLTMLRRDDGLFMVEGPVRIRSVRFDKAELEDVLFQLVGDASSLEARDINARLYGGTVQGSSRIELSGMAYTASLNIDDVETARAAAWNVAFSDQLAGRLSGHVVLTGKAEVLDEITTDWRMLDGSSVNASLLSALTQYIPQSREKKRLEVLINAGGKLPVQLFSFAVKTITSRRLLGEIHLKSRDVNLEINITNDINTDGTLTSLLGYWQTYFR